MRIDIVTLFPDYFSSPLSQSILKRAQEKEKAAFHLHNPRDYTHDRHRTVDDKPFGGGAGMVLKPEPLFECIESIPRKKAYVLLLTPRGKPFTQSDAERLSKKKQLILLCGHYEGIDERVSDKFVDEEISVGDFVAMGGEAPALCVLESVIRLVSGVLGNPESVRHESFSSVHEAGRRLESPHYTQPRVFRGKKVPEILLSGNHKKIQAWREAESFRLTKTKRPDLLKK